MNSINAVSQTAARKTMLFISGFKRLGNHSPEYISIIAIGWHRAWAHTGMFESRFEPSKVHHTFELIVGHKDKLPPRLVLTEY